MGDNSAIDDVVVNVNGDAIKKCDDSIEDCVPILLKLVTEVMGTFFLMFTICTPTVMNLSRDNVVTLPRIAIVWGFSVTVLVYSTGHISGAHFNSTITIAHASTKMFPLKQVPAYLVAQVLRSTLACGALRLIFTGKEDHFVGTLPSDSILQTFVIEFIIAFYLMFIISGVATNNRAIGELAGIAVGSTVLLNILLAGSITRASINPTRSLGPAIAHNEYKGIWISMVSPVLGALAGTWAYTFIRYTNKPVHELTKSTSSVKGAGRGGAE